MSNRALRRHHTNRLKRRRFKELKDNEDCINLLSRDDKRVGKYFQTPKKCSCYMCGNPRKFFNEKTVQEQRADQEY